MCAIFCCTTLDLPLFFRPNEASFIFCSCFFFFSAFAWSFWVAFAAFPFFPMVKKPKQPNKKNLTTQKTYRSRREINRPLQLHCPKLYFSLSLSVSGGHLCFRYGRARVWRRPFFVIPSRIPTERFPPTGPAAVTWRAGASPTRPRLRLVAAQPALSQEQPTSSMTSSIDISK